MTLNDFIREAKRVFPELDIAADDFTCYTCGMWKECKYAFDTYNLWGDCLEEK